MAGYPWLGGLFAAQRATIAEQGTPAFTGVSMRTSTQAIPIALHWGTRRISPNLIWQSPQPGSLQSGSGVNANTSGRLSGPDVGGHGYDFGGAFTPAPPTFPMGPSQGLWAIVGGTFNGRHYGNLDTSNGGQGWWQQAIMALCEGPINSIGRVWNSGNTSAVVIVSTFGTNPFILGDGAFSQTLVPPMLFYTVFQGDQAQGPWGYFAAADAQTGGPYFTGMDLSYRQTAYIASAVIFASQRNSLPTQSFEVRRTPNLTLAKRDSYGIGDDYNPRTIVTDLLTSTQYGGYLTSFDIDATSSLTYFQYTMAQGIFLSPLLDSQTAVTAILDRIAAETNTWIFWDGVTLRFVPLGDESLTANGQTYTPDPSPAYAITLNDLVEPITVHRADPIDVPNRVRFEFADRFNDYAKTPIEWKDTTLINRDGLRDASSISADDICDIVIAATALDLKAKRYAYIRNFYTFTLNARFILILPGTVLTLTDPNLGLNAVAVRVTKIDEAANGDLQVTAEEFSGVLGIARPPSYQGWTQSASSQPSGSTTGASGGSIGTPTGPGTTIVVSAGIQWVKWSAGQTIVLPAGPSIGVPIFLQNVGGDPGSLPGILNGNGNTITPWDNPLGTPVATTALKGTPGETDMVAFDGTVWNFLG